MSAKAKAAAQLLYQAHERRDRFEPLPHGLAPATAEEAYAIQDAFLALRAEKLGSIVGYKIALSSPEMQRFVGVDRPQAGAIHESTVHRTPATVNFRDYVRLIIEFEIAVEMGDDLPVADAPFSRERVAKAVGAVMPALEIADDRNADYALLPKHPLHLIADNCWNEGAVLGHPVKDWTKVDIPSARGVASINGKVVGEGRGGDCMGHPFDAVAWIADHLAVHGRGLLRGDFVITGSIVTTKTTKAGDWIVFAVEGLGSVELRVA
jgi:2-keto-4-pentenoate hydratase